MRASTDRIREIQGDGLESLKSLPYVDPNRIGVVGFSLGGYFAFILDTRNDVKAIISYYGAYYGNPVNQLLTAYTFADIVTQMKAPVLMLQADADESVPIAYANTARNLLTDSGKQPEYVVYPGAGHLFNFQGVSFDAKAAADAEQKVLTFLKTKLQ